MWEVNLPTTTCTRTIYKLLVYPCKYKRRLGNASFGRLHHRVSGWHHPPFVYVVFFVKKCVLFRSRCTCGPGRKPANWTAWVGSCARKFPVFFVLFFFFFLVRSAVKPRPRHNEWWKTTHAHATYTCTLQWLELTESRQCQDRHEGAQAGSEYLGRFESLEPCRGTA